MTVNKQITVNEKEKPINTEQKIKFTVKVWRSRIWNNKYLEADEPEEIKAKQQHEIFVVRVTRESVKLISYIHIAKSHGLIIYMIYNIFYREIQSYLEILKINF